MKSICLYMKKLVMENVGILFMLFIAVIGLIILSVVVIIPAYKEDSGQLYTSALGAPNVRRKIGEPIPVTTSEAKMSIVKKHLIGEGVCASKPILVPIIPMATILEVFVEEGDLVKKGDLLATIDDGKAQIKISSAHLAVSTAESELERVRLGSAYVLAQERPEVEKIHLRSLEKQFNNSLEKLAKFTESYEKGVISKVRLIEVQNEHALAQEMIETSELSVKMAEKGVKQSLQIAENAVADAKKALQHREKELEGYKIFAPSNGVVDRVLVHGGEYNQDSGKPGFLIASGLWFDAYFDQSDYPFLTEGLSASLSLESYPGRTISGTVRKVVPMVSFHSGGPEISRPLRPRGSGSPEWAATFKVLIDINEKNIQIVPGMTGFARIEVKREGITIERAAVTSITAGKALVYCMDADNEKTVREIQVGIIDGETVEVVSGITEGEEVIVSGHWGLRSDDEIQVVNQR